MSITTLSTSSTMSTPQELVSNIPSAISILPNHDSVHPHTSDSSVENPLRSPSPISSPSRKARQTDDVQIPKRVHPKPLLQNRQQGIKITFKPERGQTNTGKTDHASHSDPETTSRSDVSDGSDQDSEEEDDEDEDEDEEDEDDEDYTEHDYQPTRPMSVSTRKSLASPGTEPAAAAAPGEIIPAFAPVHTSHKNALPLPRGRANSPRDCLPSPTSSLPSTQQPSRSFSHSSTSPHPVPFPVANNDEPSPPARANAAPRLISANAALLSSTTSSPSSSISSTDKRSVPISDLNTDPTSRSKRTRRTSYSPTESTVGLAPDRRGQSSSPEASVASSSTSSSNIGPRSTSPVKVDRRRKGNGGGRWPSGAPRSSAVSLESGGPSPSNSRAERNESYGTVDIKTEEQSTELLLDAVRPDSLVDSAQLDGEEKEPVSGSEIDAIGTSVASSTTILDVSSLAPPLSSELSVSLSKTDSVESSVGALRKIVPKIVLVQSSLAADASTDELVKSAPVPVASSRSKASRETTPAGQPSKKALHAAEMKLLRARKRRERMELVEIELKALDELYDSVANNTDQSLVKCWTDLHRRYTGASIMIENRKRQAEAELVRVYDADISFTWSWWNISRFDMLNKEKAELSSKLQKLGREHRQIQTAALPPSERYLPAGSRAPFVPNPRYVVHTSEYQLSNDDLGRQGKKRKKRRIAEPESSDDESIGVKGLKPDDVESDLNKLGLGKAEKERERLRLIGVRQEEERMKREEEERVRAQLDWEAKEAREAERKLEEQEWERKRAMSILEAQRLKAEKREQDAVDYRSHRDANSYPLPMAKPSRTKNLSGKPKTKTGKSSSTSKSSRSSGMLPPPPPSAPTLSSSSSADIKPVRSIKTEPSSGPIFPPNPPLSPVVPSSAHPWNDPHPREPASYYLGGGSSHQPYPSPHYGPSSYANVPPPNDYPQHLFPSPLNWIPGQASNQESQHQSIGRQGSQVDALGSSGPSRNGNLSMQDHPSIHPFHLNPYVSFSSMGDNRNLLSHIPQQQQQQRSSQHPYQHQPYQSQHQHQQPYSISPSHHEHILNAQSHPHHQHVVHHHQQPSHTSSGSQPGSSVDPSHRSRSTSVTSSTPWRPVGGGNNSTEPNRSNYLPHSFLNPLPPAPPNQGHHSHAQQQQLPPLPFGSANHQLHPLTGPGHPLWGISYGAGNSR